MLIASQEKDIIAWVKAGIAEKFRIKDLGRARFILGIDIDYDVERKALTNCQRARTESIINRFDQENAKPFIMSLDPSVHLTKYDEPQTDEDKVRMKSKPYRSLVGSLLYLACRRRPDIAVTVTKLSRFLENPGQKHWDAGIKVVRYLLKTKDVGITYDGLLGTELTAYSDVDWTGNRDDRGSVSGMMLIICGAPVAWRSTFQKTVALSSTEAGYMALSECVKEVVWMRRLLKDLGPEQDKPTLIYENNQGQWLWRRTIKHIDNRYHFVCEEIISGEVGLVFEQSKK
ncbi:Retrovirus-related pol Polyprotein [Phytophthora palmivora]|uniref:Retrovirus-related pol Polyprotein n=1 Tax=Phytophthora palmivora TaxID=4796 RepID=A0A2P4XFG4_9STRA|nr:Retrovirus-related pol Polyprotein [Phytophthora palmivora]